MRIEKKTLNDALRVLGKVVCQTSPVERKMENGAILWKMVPFYGTVENGAILWNSI